MAQNKNNKKDQNRESKAAMNLKRAREIVASGERGLDFDAALQYLRIYDPKNHVFDEIDKKEHQDDEKKHQDEETPDKDEEAKTAEAVENAMRFIKEDRNERECLGEEKQGLKEDVAVEKNLNEISSIFADAEFNKNLRMIINRDTVHIAVEDNVDVNSGELKENGNILGDGEGKDGSTITEEEDRRKQILNEALEAAKHEVLMFYGRDELFASYDEKQKSKILKDSVVDVFNFKMMKAVGASAVKEATKEEAVPQSKANEDYIRRSETDMRDALKAFFEKRPVRVKSQQVLNTAVHTSDAMDEYEQGLRAAKLEKSAESFNQKKEDYNQKRRGFWGKAFDMAKGVWQGLKQNKARIITDAAVVAGAGLTAGVAPIAAAAGLATYFAVSSFAWLVNDERRNQKAKAEDKANWSGFKGLNNAWKSIKSDEKKLRKFKVNGGLTAAAGVAGAGLFGWAATGAMATALGLGTAKAAAANTVLARAMMGAARSLGSVSSQGTNWALASSDYKKDASEENKTALDSAKKGFFISAGAALLSNTVSAAINADGLDNGGADGAAHGADGAAHGADGSAHGADGSAHGGADGSAHGGADGSAHGGVDGSAHGGDGSAHGGDGSAHDTTPIDHTPVEWQGNITEKQWNSLNRDITGIYKDHAEIFGKGNINPKDAMENVYQNIDNARAAGYFQGQSNEEVLYKYIQLIKQTERVEVLKGTNYLVTKVGADGNPMYWVNAEEMNALNKIIICNEVTKVSADKLDGVLNLINEKGKYIGEGADIGVTNNTFAGARVNCEDYQNAWERHAFVNKHPHTDNTPTPAPEEAKVDETFADKHKAPEGANVDETVNNVQKKAPTEQFTWKEQKFTGKDNTAISGSGDTPVKTVAQGRGVLNSGR